MKFLPGLFAALTAVLSTTAPAQEESAPKDLKFDISSATVPGSSKPAYTGKVSFTRSSTAHCFQVKWKLSDGSSQTGIAVPFPQSGYIAVGYGPDLQGVAIYKKNGDSMEARWAVPGDEAEMGNYQLTRGDKPGVMKITGGGTVTLTPGKENTATLKLDLKGASSSGVAIYAGDFMALATGGKRMGVGIYQQAGEGAEGHWTVVGAEGAGTENLKILEVDGQKVDAPESQAKDTPDKSAGSEEAEVKAIAKAVRGSREELLKLKPTRAQLADIAASAEDTKLLEAYVKALFEDLPEEGLTADEDETKIVVFSGKDLPGGYREEAEHLGKDVKIYGFKYLNPGKQSGTSFDGLIKVRGKWIMVPKLWRAFK